MKKKIDIFWYWFLVIVSFVICFMFSSAINAKAGTLLGNVTYNEGQILVDSSTGTTLEVRKGTTKYYIICNTSTKTIIYHDCTWSDTEGLVCNKYISTKTNGDMETSSGTYTYTFLGFGGQGLVMNNKYYLIQNTSSGYTEEDLNAKYQEGFEDGEASVDITSNDQQVIQDYITSNNYHSNDDYLNYGNQKYQEGQNSVDITTDNEAYAEQVIQDKLDKNQLFDPEYVFDLTVSLEQQFYQEGYQEGQASVDITSNDEQVIQDYITNNNYHTNTDYLNYGNQKYTEGQNSVDITSNDAQVIQDYITLNNMKTEEDYLNYGSEQRREGYFTSYNNFISAYDQVYSTNNYMTGIGYTCETYTSGAYSCSEAYKGYLNDLNNAAVNSVDITINDSEVYSVAFLEGEAQGYDKAVSDGKSLATFIPNLLGGFGSFFLTIMNIDILGFNLLSIFGIAITIGIIILILKFMRG